MKKFISPELIRKYLTGKCTPEEVAKVLEWYESGEQEPDPLAYFTPQERIALKEMMYSNVVDRIRSQKAYPNPVFSGLIRQRVILGGVAAAILLFAAIRIVLHQPETFETGTQAVIGTIPADEACAEPAEVLVENKLRTIKRQTLSDGSVIWLQPETWISFPREFGADGRQVRMSGEAFFEVSPDSSRPFVVYSGDLITRVVGTSFNIKAYKDGPSAEVSVFTGKVSVSLPDIPDVNLRSMSPPPLLLSKHEKAVFSSREKSLEKKAYSTHKEPELNMWKKNTISFDNTPVKEVVEVLNREFDVSLQVDKTAKELNSYMLKADFTNQNLPDILQMLEKSLNLTYEIDGKDIVLKLDK